VLALGTLPKQCENSERAREVGKGEKKKEKKEKKKKRKKKPYLNVLLGPGSFVHHFALFAHPQKATPTLSIMELRLYFF
jgi:hypothetical protein